jgi:hypothetical protein
MFDSHSPIVRCPSMCNYFIAIRFVHIRGPTKAGTEPKKRLNKGWFMSIKFTIFPLDVLRLEKMLVSLEISLASNYSVTPA